MITQRRKVAAKIAREIRSYFPRIAGAWTRREWNEQARRAAHAYLTAQETARAENSTVAV